MEDSSEIPQKPQSGDTPNPDGAGSESSADTPQGKRKISRRDFLKGALVLGAGLTLKSSAPPNTEEPSQPTPPDRTSEENSAEERREIPRFFEDVDNFNPSEMKPALEKDLENFAELFAPAIEAHLNTDPEYLKASLTDAVHALDGIYTSYSTLKESDNPVHQAYASEEIRGVFYDIGSALYSLQKVYQQYKDSPSDFESIIKQYAENGFVSDRYGDELIHDELFTISAAWADPSNIMYPSFFQEHDHPARYQSPVIELIASERGFQDEPLNNEKQYPGILRLLRKLLLHQYPPETGVESLRDARLEPVPPKIKEELGIEKDHRQKEAEIVADPQVQKYVRETLRNHGLSRIVPEVRIMDEMYYGRGMFEAKGTSYDDIRRSLHLNTDIFNTEAIEQHPHLAEHTVIHEAGHAVDFAINYLPYADSQKLRAEMDAVLEQFRPFSVKGIFTTPDGTPISRAGDSFERDDAFYKDINWHTLTDYSIEDYMNSYNFLVLNIDQGNSGIVSEADKFFQVFKTIDDNPALEYVRDGKVEEVADLPAATFKEFFDAISEKMKETPIGSLMAQAIQDRMGILNNITRDKFNIKDSHSLVGDWGNAYQAAIMPAVFAELIATDAPQVEKALIESSTRSDEEVRLIKHLVRTYKRKFDRVKKYADTELWADVFAFAKRRSGDSVTVSDTIPDEIWQNTDKVIEKIQDTLVSNGLAYSQGDSSNAV